MKKIPSKPLIACNTNAFIEDNGQLNYQERARYVDAIVWACDAIPMMIPCLGERLDLDGVLDHVDGILFTGSPSNVHPSLYGMSKEKPETKEDRLRDATTLPLMRRAQERGVPILCICRGFQECNVAFGGTLYEHIEELPGKLDHRWNEHTQFSPVHAIEVAKGGVLDKLYQGQRNWQVNSAHGQGIRDLSPRLRVEAVAPDGVVEALSMPNSKGFLLAIQWHPEHSTVLNEWHNMEIFKGFRQAIDAYRAQK